MKQDKRRELRQQNQNMLILERSQVVLQRAAEMTQQQLEYHISELGTLAAQSVFTDPYQLSVEFIQRRGKTEADIFFDQNGKKIHPLSADAGGAVDVAAFALQVTLWSLRRPKTRNVLILDEPLKHLKGGNLPAKGAEMIKELSSKLGLQIIMVSHDPTQIESADRVFHITKRKGVSYVSQNGG